MAIVDGFRDGGAHKYVDVVVRRKIAFVAHAENAVLFVAEERRGAVVHGGGAVVNHDVLQVLDLVVTVVGGDAEFHEVDLFGAVVVLIVILGACDEVGIAIHVVAVGHIVPSVRGGVLHEKRTVIAVAGVFLAVRCVGRNGRSVCMPPIRRW